MKCWRCDGNGSYPIGIITGNGEWTTIMKQCPTCTGTGDDAQPVEAARPAPAGTNEADDASL